MTLNVCIFVQESHKFALKVMFRKIGELIYITFYYSYCKYSKTLANPGIRSQGSDSGRLVSPRVKSGNARAYATRWRP